MLFQILQVGTSPFSPRSARPSTFLIIIGPFEQDRVSNMRKIKKDIYLMHRAMYNRLCRDAVSMVCFFVVLKRVARNITNICTLVPFSKYALLNLV
jgi:hypothetical protein